MPFYGDKFEELVLYFAERSAEDPLFGATKLNKLLFLADFLAYGELGHSITGAEYRWLPNGPAPRELPRVQQRMIEDGSLEIAERPHFGRIQKQPRPLRNADTSVFEEDERAHIDEVLRLVQSFNATEISQFSHEAFAGWQLADKTRSGTIPYEAVFVSTRAPTDAEIERGRELAAEHGWT